MPQPLRLMAVLAHPDDESLGFGGTLAKYAAQGVYKHTLSPRPAGTGARFGDHRFGTAGHTGRSKRIARIPEAELRVAALILGLHDLSGWDIPTAIWTKPIRGKRLVASSRVWRRVRRRRGHHVRAGRRLRGISDHIAISQFAVARRWSPPPIPDTYCRTRAPALAPCIGRESSSPGSRPQSAWDIVPGPRSRSSGPNGSTQSSATPRLARLGDHDHRYAREHIATVCRRLLPRVPDRELA